jgi:hypothetical protein
MSDPNRLQSQTLSWFAFALGVLFLASGLIFLCASVENRARFPVSFVLLAIGAGLAAWAGSRWRRVRRLSPEILGQRITDLAANQDGEVTMAYLLSALDVPDGAARAALSHLEGNGLCRQERREDKLVYVFPGLQQSKVVRKCAYCGNEYSVREPLTKCPNCGGTLRVAKT